MKLRLIAPASVHSSPATSTPEAAASEKDGVIHRPLGDKGLFPPLSLAVLASLTPDSWEVDVVDENVDLHDIDADRPEVVGITAITSVAPRAYQIAAEYRKRGVKVIMGGMHASVLPEEALEHVDAVVVGEAEGVWEAALEDARRGRLERLYEGGRPSLEGLPRPRLELFDPRKYVTTNLVQTSRGCPFNCSFCSVTRFFGRTYRTRPVEEVVDEVAGMRGPVLFVDDNVVGNRKHAKSLFTALSKLRPKVTWLGQSSITIAEDEELLDLAAESGCAGLFIGFESIVAENLQRVGKGMVNKVERFLEAIRKVHRRGIGIEGAFIFGLDGDDPSIFRRTVEFAQRAKLALAQFGILTPFPGTRLYEEMKSQGRILVRDWSKYTISNVVFAPVGISKEALEEGFKWAYREFYSYRSIFGRLFNQRRNLWLFILLNLSFKKIADRLSSRNPLHYPATQPQ